MSYIKRYLEQTIIQHLPTLELFVEDEKTFAELYAKNNRYLITS